MRSLLHPGRSAGTVGAALILLGSSARAQALDTLTALKVHPPLVAAAKEAPASGSSSRLIPTKKHRWRRRHVARRRPSKDTLAAANAAARDVPTPGSYLNSAVIYDYEPARLFTIRTSPRFLTALALKPGEKLIAKAAGDTVRWVLGETAEGSGDAERVLILVKPMRGALRTNIVLTTDQRTYLVDASSSDADVYTSLVTWNYPQDQARALSAPIPRKDPVAGAVVTNGLPVDRLNFNYKIEPIHSRSPTWQPLRAFDDGSKTYVEFPDTLGSAEAPPLFLLGDAGTAQLVNYRVQGVYYIIDRLIDVAELRLGEKSQTIVRITRQESRSR